MQRADEKDDRSSSLRAMQFMNILFMLVTCAVLKLDTLSAFNLEQLANIEPISCTLEVSKENKSSDSS